MERNGIIHPPPPQQVSIGSIGSPHPRLGHPDCGVLFHRLCLPGRIRPSRSNVKYVQYASR